MKRAMQLRIRMTVDDGALGHPSRLALAFQRVRMELERGELGGSFELNVPNVVNPNTLEQLTVDFDVLPTEPYDPEVPPR